MWGGSRPKVPVLYTWGLLSSLPQSLYPFLEGGKGRWQVRPGQDTLGPWDCVMWRGKDLGQCDPESAPESPLGVLVKCSDVL